MELMLLSILSPAVKCQWDLSSGEEAAITSVIFSYCLCLICVMVGNGRYVMVPVLTLIAKIMDYSH